MKRFPWWRNTKRQDTDGGGGGGGQKGQPLLLEISVFHPSRGRAQWPGPAREWRGRRATSSDISRVKTSPEPSHLLQPRFNQDTLCQSQRSEARMGHPSCPKTRYVNLRTCFTHLYFPALSDVCPTFLLFDCERMRVLTLPISLQEWFSELDDAGQVARGLFN